MRRSAPLFAVLFLAAAASPARASIMPNFVLELGKSFAVYSPTAGQFDQGGFATALAALWPVEDRFRFGFAGFAYDIGAGALTDTTASLGQFDLAHVNVYGGAWRMEVVGPRFLHMDTFARGDWGVYRFRADRHGSYLADATKTGWNLGGGLMLPVWRNQAVGLTYGYNRVFSDITRHFQTVALAWHWRPDTPSERTPWH
jgi:opacity protein-like surface antigen